MVDLDPRRELPSVDRLLQGGRVQLLLAQHPRELVVQAAREVLASVRLAVQQDGAGDSEAALGERVAERVGALLAPPLRPVINATGVVIHTNLGRAPLSTAALEATRSVAAGYSNLEYDLAGGARGSRHDLATDLLRRLTGAEDALVVNNNASAVLLALSALAAGREVVISRGQLVEIGGGFRIPDVLRQSGAQLVEVGTTNRTYVADYETAISSETALLLRVHSSNFLQVGFTTQPSLADLVALGQRHGLPVVDDLGSGSLIDTSRFGLAGEPMVQDSVAAGAALTCFSGDKLLGGPQAGIVVGQREWMGRLKQHPLIRALRPDKMTLAALTMTLLHYLRGEAERELPVWRMISASTDELQERGNALAGTLGGVTVVESAAAVGGGSLPGQTLPSRALAVSTPAPDQLARALRLGDPAVLGRIERDSLLLDLRTVLPEQDQQLSTALRAALTRVG